MTVDFALDVLVVALAVVGVFALTIWTLVLVDWLADWLSKRRGK